MKQIFVDDLYPGMILGQTIFNEYTKVELLVAGTLLNLRHIELIRRMELTIIDVLDEGEQVNILGQSFEENRNDRIEKIESFKKEFEYLEKEDYEPVLKNIVNVNMKVNVLTGEGNVPFDKKHEKFIERTKEAFDALKTSNDIDFKRIQEDVRSSLPDMIRNNDVLMRLNQLEKTNNKIFEHSLRVAMLSTMIAKWLGYNPLELEEISEAAMLHDIGIMKMPDFILDEDFNELHLKYDIFMKHPQLSYQILLKTPGVNTNVKFAVLQHHERMNGSGYPLKVSEGQIHEYAKIIMVADVFDNLTYNSKNGEESSPFAAAEYLSWNTGELFDPKVVYIFISNLAQYYAGKEVELNNGQRGRIIFIDTNFPTRPVIKTESGIVDLVRIKNLRITRLY
jgi:putative nucleotidyltransferase with HDIG domain